MAFYIECIDVAIKAGNFDIYHRQQLAFHQVYIQKCGNKTLIENVVIIDTTTSKVYTNSVEQHAMDMLYDVNDEHRRILQLLKDGDQDGVSKFITEKHWVPVYKDDDIIF